MTSINSISKENDATQLRNTKYKDLAAMTLPILQLYRRPAGHACILQVFLAEYFDSGKMQLA